MVMCLLTASITIVSCSKDSDGDSVKTVTLSFRAIDGSYESYGAQSDANYPELLKIINEQIKKELGGRQEVSIQESKVADYKAELAKKLEDFASEINDSKKYPGSYSINVKCNEVNWISLSFETPIEHAFLSVSEPVLYYLDENNQNVVLKDGETTTNAILFSERNIVGSHPDFDIDPAAYDGENIELIVYNAYDEEVYSYVEALTPIMTRLKLAKKYNNSIRRTLLFDGGEYVCVDKIDIFNEIITTHITIKQDAQAKVSLNDSLTVYFTTGYPFNPADYSKAFDVEYTIKKIDGDTETEVKKGKEAITLVKDASRTKVASVYDLKIYNRSDFKSGKYAVEVKSDWPLANTKFEFEI